MKKTKKYLRLFRLSKVIFLAIILTFLSPTFHGVTTSKQDFEKAGCLNVIEKNTIDKKHPKTVLASHKNTSKNPCLTSPIVQIAGAPLPFIYDNFKGSDIGTITFNDNIFIKPLFIDFIFYIGVALIIFLVIFLLKKYKLLSRIVLLLTLSFILTLLSSYYPSNDTVITSGEGYCGKARSCSVKVITGGFPFKYLYDTLGVSIEGSLTYEDTWKLKPFLYNILFYFLLFFPFAIFKNSKRTLKEGGHV